MPTFKFLNTETSEEFEDFLTNSRKEELLQKNPHIQQMPTSFGITSMSGSFDSKTDDTWKEVLSKVAEAHPESPVGERYGKKSIKDVRTRNIVDTHFRKWKNT
jgi:hypothetical protein